MHEVNVCFITSVVVQKPNGNYQFLFSLFFKSCNSRSSQDAYFFQAVTLKKVNKEIGNSHLVFGQGPM